MKLDKVLLVATSNLNKAKEFSEILKPLDIQVETLADYPDLPSIEETGITFEENARLKAETIAELTGRVVIADDSGLTVNVLHGRPGVLSSRYAGEPTSDARNNAKLLAELGEESSSDRSAAFHTTIVASYPGYDSLVISTQLSGEIVSHPRGENGFGYDSLFLPNGMEETFGEMDPEIKNRMSHRALAVQQLLVDLPNWLADIPEK